MTVEVVVRKFRDNRLMLVVVFREGSNFWIYHNGSCSYVPRKSEIELIKESLEAVDTHNKLKQSVSELGS